jgi:O-antigen ligase
VVAQYLHHGSINGLFYFFGERKFTSTTPGIANASINGELILRPYGTFPHPNVLAGFLLCSLIFIFAFFEVKKDIKKKILKIIALLLGSTALFLTLSRVAIILWIFIAIIALYEKLIKGNRLQFGKNLNHQSWAYALFIIIIFVSLLLLTPVLPRLEGTNFAEEAFSQRADLFKSTLIMIKDHPLFGVGLLNFLPSLSHIQKPLSPTLYLQPVHNIFLLITAEAGIIGLAFSLWFLFKTYKRLLFHLSSTLLILFSVILILGLFDHYWLTLQQGQLLFALIIGLCWAL